MFPVLGPEGDREQVLFAGEVLPRPGASRIDVSLTNQTINVILVDEIPSLRQPCQPLRLR